MRRTTVEECRSLDAARLGVFGMFADGFASGKISWSDHAGRETASIGYFRHSGLDGSKTLKLSFTLTRFGDSTSVEQTVALVSTAPNFGGLRWWFVCPLVPDFTPCERRVRVLYLPSGQRYFGCRCCYNLTYDSVRTHDGRIGRLRANPATLIAALESKSPRRALLGLRAALHI